MIEQMIQIQEETWSGSWLWQKEKHLFTPRNMAQEA